MRTQTHLETPDVNLAHEHQPSAAWRSPVLASVSVASGLCRNVRIEVEHIERVADWMCFEKFAPIDANTPDDPERPALPTRREQIDFTMVTMAINFAYTDFETSVAWSVEEAGGKLVDADAMFVRFEQAYAAGTPVLDGQWLAELTEQQLAAVLHGPRPIPMLVERVRVLRGIGAELQAKYDGSFTNFVDDCAPRAWSDGNGLLERLIAEFRHFDDSALVHGQPVQFHKLAQLAVWTLHRLGLVQLEDADSLAVFADYIVPAALRAMRVLSYSPDLARAIDEGQLITAGSTAELEIRTQTVMACGLLTEALNRRRDEPIINPQLDFRLWSAFHDNITPHHLTQTTRY